MGYVYVVLVSPSFDSNQPPISRANRLEEISLSFQCEPMSVQKMARGGSRARTTGRSTVFKTLLLIIKMTETFLRSHTILSYFLKIFGLFERFHIFTEALFLM